MAKAKRFREPRTGQHKGIDARPTNRQLLQAPIHFYTERSKPLAQLRAADVPPGLDPDDVATDVNTE